MKTAILMDLKFSIGMVSSLILYVLVGVFVGIVSESHMLGIGVTLGVFVVGNTMGFPIWDETNGWDRTRLTLPIERKDVVIGRYISMLLIAAFSYVIAIVVWVISGAIGCAVNPSGAFAAQFTFDGMFLDCLVAVVAVAAVQMLIAAVSFPMSFKMGNSKSAKWVPAATCVFFALVVASSGMILEAHPEWEAVLDAMTTGDMGMFFAGMFAVCFVLYVISCFLSVKFLESREY